jgi:hypothetical protein
MSVQDLILNFILGVMASYLASEIREHPAYAQHTLKRLLYVVKAFCCQAISTLLSIFQQRAIPARIKLNRNYQLKDLYGARTAFFITLFFLAVVIFPFKVSKDMEYDVDEVALRQLEWQLSEHLDSEWAIKAIIEHERAHLRGKVERLR